jgi:hypothetical protein
MVSSLAVVAARSASAVADAPSSKAECLDANTRGQDLRRGGAFSAAREQFRRCGDPSCPALVRDDCAKRLDELDRAQPTIVFEVKDSTGKDVSVVHVLMDGAPWVDHLAATAVPVEPGNHTFRFERPREQPVEVKLFVREGEKDRHERVVIGNEVAASPTAPASAAGSPPEPAGGSSAKTIGLFVGGAGLAAIVAGSISGGLATSSWSSSRSECSSPTACTMRKQAVSDHDTAVTMATVSTVAFIGGGVALATAAVLWLTAPSGNGSAPTTGVVLAPGIGPGSEGVSVHGTF